MSKELSPNQTLPETTVAAEPSLSVDEHIGSRIRARRRALRMTQDDLAGRVGVTAQQIHKYENGSNRVAASKLFEIATVLCAPVSAFFDGIVAPEEDVETQHRMRERLLLDKEMLELAMSFDDIEEARLRRVVLRIIRAATDAQKEQD